MCAETKVCAKRLRCGWLSESCSRWASSHRMAVPVCASLKAQLVVLCDSRVIVGAWSKGRSSSRQLNGLLRSCLAWSIAGRKLLCLLWVGTHFNPADGPSRGKGVPASVGSPPEWILAEHGDVARTYTRDMLLTARASTHADASDPMPIIPLAPRISQSSCCQRAPVKSHRHLTTCQQESVRCCFSSS